MIFHDQIIRTVVSNNGSYYRELGYGECKQGTEIFVHIKDLRTNSNLKVAYKCDHCETNYDRQYQVLMRQKLHLCKGCSRKHIGKTMDRTNIDSTTKNRTGEKHPRWNSNKSGLQIYSNKVRSLTEKTYKKYEQKINPLKLPRTLCGVDGGYQLDHKISIKFGFMNNISPEILSSVENLQMLPWRINRIKHCNNSI